MNTKQRNNLLLVMACLALLIFWPFFIGGNGKTPTREEEKHAAEPVPVAPAEEDEILFSWSPSTEEKALSDPLDKEISRYLHKSIKEIRDSNLISINCRHQEGTLYLCEATFVAEGLSEDMLILRSRNYEGFIEKVAQKKKKKMMHAMVLEHFRDKDYWRMKFVVSGNLKDFSSYYKK